MNAIRRDRRSAPSEDCKYKSKEPLRRSAQEDRLHLRTEARDARAVVAWFLLSPRHRDRGGHRQRYVRRRPLHRRHTGRR